MNPPFHKKYQMLMLSALAISLVPFSAYAQKKPVVGLVMKSLANEFFKDMEEGAVKHAQERGDLTLVPVGMHSETDIDTQIAAVENFITQKVDAIVVAPADSRALVPPLARAIKAGIVVINIDVALDEAAKKQAGVDLAFVGPDNRTGAKMSGAVLAKALGPGGKVVILEGNPGADNAIQRKLGFDDAVKEGQLALLDSRTAHWETEALTKLLPGVIALTGLDLTLATGEFHALVGENGAGNSTLIKLLCGSYTPDAGQMRFGGLPYLPASPLDALKAGIRVVYQEFNLLPFLSVAENLLFDSLPRRYGLFVNYRTLHDRSKVLLERVGLDVDPQTPAEHLGIAP